MQAILETSELAYLLQTLGAEKAIGVDNSRLFPSRPALRAALLREGFARLQQHGWLVPSDGAIQTNDRLMLMAAVVADPAWTFTVTHLAGDDRRQTVTYCANQGLVVELYASSDGEYVLGQLEAAELVARVRDACSAWLVPAQADTSLVCTFEAFEQALAQARAGDPDAPARLLPALAGLQLVGHVEGAVLFDRTIRAWGQLAIMRAANGAYWLAQNDDRANTIELWTATPARFETLLERLLESLAPTSAAGGSVQ